jgi:hypothetical protein
MMVAQKIGRPPSGTDQTKVVSVTRTADVSSTTLSPPQPDRHEQNPTPTDGQNRQRPSAMDRRISTTTHNRRAPLALASTRAHASPTSRG